MPAIILQMMFIPTIILLVLLTTILGLVLFD